MAYGSKRGGQGQRGLPGAKTSKTPGNPTKPKLKANIKNSQGIMGGVKQGRAGAKYVTSNARGGSTGLKQNTVKPNLVQTRGQNNLNKAPIKPQPKIPKNKPIQPKNNMTLHNKVTKSDVRRTEGASQKTVAPKAISGKGANTFKNFIGGN